MSMIGFVPPCPLNTAVLFMVFNRPDATRQVFEAIRKAQPPRLYVAADGYRADCLGEDEKVFEVRNYVKDNIDWKCEVKTLFRDSNLGCKYAVSGAIKWFFEHEEMGIILEDDCLPSQSFFWFCEELLVKYKDDERIGLISGRNNMELYPKNCEYSYLFTFATSTNIWGWATWRRVAKFYDPNHPILNSSLLKKCILNSICNKYETYYLVDKVKRSLNGNTWDYQWTALQFLNSQYSIVPTRNMINNIGFDESATHTKNKKHNLSQIKKSDIFFPLVHPPFVFADRSLFFRLIRYRKPTQKAKAVIKQIINKFL